MTIDTKRRVARLRELAKKLTGDERTVMRELALEVPPNEDRDVDYLLDWAADEIDRLRAENKRLQGIANAFEIVKEQRNTLQSQMEAVRVAASDNQMTDVEVASFLARESFDPGWVRYDLIEQAVMFGTGKHVPELEDDE